MTVRVDPSTGLPIIQPTVVVNGGGGGGGTSVWGGITGTLSDQTDLQTALNAKEGKITSGTTSQYWRGDKSWQTLDNTAVGLSNVDNTSDATKNSATATLTNKTLDNTNTVTLKDTNFTLQDDGDTTKQMQFQLSGITTGTIRTLTMPDADGTLVLKDSNGNITANNFNRSLTSTVANAATPITMTIASSAVQVVTGTNSQTINLPTTGVTAGTQYKFINKAAFTLNVKASNGGTTALLTTLLPNTLR